MTTNVTISNDHAILGDNATLSDLEGYAENLASLLSDEFEVEVNVVLASVFQADADREDIRARVLDLHRGDDWITLLP